MKIRQQLFGQAIEMAESLVAEFHAGCPPAMVLLANARARALHASALKRLLRSVAEAQAVQRLGIFRRIVFARAFQRALKAQGYPASFNREITAKVLVRLSMAGRQAPGDRA